MKQISSSIVLLVVGLLFCQLVNAKSVLDIQHWRTKNGVRVLFVRSTQLPMVDIRVVFDAGSARDGNRPGLANIANDLLDKGAGKLSADQVAEQFDNVGANYSAVLNRDMAMISLRTLSEPKYFTPALNTFINVLTRPRFTNKAFMRERKQVLRTIQLQQQYPGVVADIAFYKALYGNQPYAHPVIGVKNSVTKITRVQVKQFYRRYYVASNALVVMVGNLGEQQAKQVANDITKGLRKGKPAPTLTTAAPSKMKQDVIAFPSKQTHILIGEIGINRDNPAYFPLKVGNFILGGQPLIARLFHQVRDKLGLAYSVSSDFETLRNRGPFVIEMQTRNNKAEEALQVSKQIVERFIKNGPTKQELKLAKQNIIGSFPLSIANNSAIVSNLVSIGFYDLPLNYLDTYRNKVRNVTVKQIREAFQKQLNIKSMSIIMVGHVKHENRHS